jgi:hypothetical protein
MDMNDAELVQQHLLERIPGLACDRGIQGGLERFRLERELHPALGGFNGNRVGMLQNRADAGIKGHALRPLVQNGGLARGLQEPSGLADGLEERLRSRMLTLGIVALQEGRMGVA